MEKDPIGNALGKFKAIMEGITRDDLKRTATRLDTAPQGPAAVKPNTVPEDAAALAAEAEVQTVLTDVDTIRSEPQNEVDRILREVAREEVAQENANVVDLEKERVKRQQS